MQDLQAFTCLPLGWEEAVAAAELAWRMARMGRRVPTIDLLIAGAAMAHHYEIWHFGDSHFVAIAAAGGPPQRNLRPSRD